ncbi:MAG: tetratricopeptide repeat protein [Muribaculaceae bacterium]|nr:tetratricopeptide repeat protein [Muribaculaceae bacterium]
MTFLSVDGIKASGKRDRDKTPRIEKAAREKARYYYLEGLRHQVEGRHAEAYENFRHSHNVDPTFPEGAYSYGQMRLIGNVDTLGTPAELSRSLALMRPYVDTYPEDFDEVIYYGYVAARLDSLDEAVRVYERTDSLLPKRTTTLLHLSDVYFAKREDEKGFEALNRYEKIEGKSPNLTLKKISYLINRLDTIGAIREATSLVESNPREPAYLILKGNLFQLMDRKDSVEAYFKMAEDLAPGYGAAKVALADFYRDQGDSVAYDNKTYEALLAEDFGLEEKTALLSEYLQKLIYDKSNTKRGDYLFSVLETQYPFETDVLDLAARYSAAKGDYATAIEKIGYAIDLDASNDVYWGQKMSYLISDDRPKDAVATYREAITHVEPSMGLRMMCASAAQIDEDYDLAVKMYGELINQLAPNAPVTGELTLAEIPKQLTLEGLEQLSNLYTTIGDCSFNAGKIEQAFRSYENALLLDPENAMALNNYAYFMVESGGDINKAADLSSRSLVGENEDNPTFLDTYAWILYKQGKYDEAAEYQKRAIANCEGTASESSELWEHYGDILLAIGNRQEAVEAWKKALDLTDEKNAIIKKINENK